MVSPALVILLLVAAGCSSNTVENTQPNQGPLPATETPVVGRATWYGPGFIGNKTASGEIFQKNPLKAAHGQLPIGMKVQLLQEDTNESVIVVINNRTAFKEGRVIDLAHVAADQLEVDKDGEDVDSPEVLD